MIIPEGIQIFGDQSYRGDCPSEDSEHVAFIAWLRHKHPNLAAVAVHPQNEGKRTAQQASMARKMGSLTKGASDVIIPGSPSLLIELKRRDHTKSVWQTGQREYLQAAAELGAFACVALGADGAKKAVEEWFNVLYIG